MREVRRMVLQMKYVYMATLANNNEPFYFSVSGSVVGIPWTRDYDRATRFESLTSDDAGTAMRYGLKLSTDYIRGFASISK